MTTAERATLQKQERLGGKLQGTEVIDVSFQEKPFSVLLDWQRGTRLAQRTLYQKGQNRDKRQEQMRLDPADGQRHASERGMLTPQRGQGGGQPQQEERGLLAKEEGVHG